jgi:hypothetical protein
VLDTTNHIVYKAIALSNYTFLDEVLETPLMAPFYHDFVPLCLSNYNFVTMFLKEKNIYLHTSKLACVSTRQEKSYKFYKKKEILTK